MKNRTKSRP